MSLQSPRRARGVWVVLRAWSDHLGPRGNLFIAPGARYLLWACVGSGWWVEIRRLGLWDRGARKSELTISRPTWLRSEAVRILWCLHRVRSIAWK